MGGKVIQANLGHARPRSSMAILSCTESVWELVAPGLSVYKARLDRQLRRQATGCSPVLIELARWKELTAGPESG